MPLFHHRVRHTVSPTSYDSTILAHDTRGRLRVRGDTMSPRGSSYYHHHDKLYFDPSYRYDYGDQRYVSGHPHDIRDPYLKTHMRQIRRMAQHGELNRDHPAFASFAESEDMFHPAYLNNAITIEPEYRFRRSRTRSRGRSGLVDTKRDLKEEGTRGDSSLRRNGFHRHHNDSRYTESSYRQTGSMRRSSSVPNPRPRSTTHGVAPIAGYIPSRDKISGYGREIPELRRGQDISPKLIHSKSDVTTDMAERVVFHPTARAGTLECEHGSTLPLGAKQTVPYTSHATEISGRTISSRGAPPFSRTISAPLEVTHFHPQSLTVQATGGQESSQGTVGQYNGGTPRGYTTLPPRTTVDAIDRANRIALSEQERDRVKSYTKVGPITVVHGSNRAYENARRMAIIRRSHRLRDETHTTTEKAVLRANALASMELARDAEQRRSWTRVGRWVM